MKAAKYLRGALAAVAGVAGIAGWLTSATAGDIVDPSMPQRFPTLTGR
jgi:hypothetical protein